MIYRFTFQGFAEVDELLKKEGICLAMTDKLIKDSGVATAAAYDNIVHNLKKTNARGVIVFGSDQVNYTSSIHSVKWHNQ